MPRGLRILLLLGASLQKPHRAQPASRSHECPFAESRAYLPTNFYPQDPFLFSQMGSAGEPRVL